MIDTDRQVPTPSASAWSFDLSRLGGPRFVVLNANEAEARTHLAEHLLELGRTGDLTEIQTVAGERVAVVW